MRIAITGASGHVGQGVVPMALSRGHSVLSIVHSSPAKQEERAGLAYLQVEMIDYAAVEQALLGCDAVIHLAAIPAPKGHPDHFVHNNNVVSSYNVLSASARLGIARICMASSVNATGGVWSRQPRYDYFPLDERHPTYNEDAYSLSKWIGEQQADSFARRYSFMAIASLRLHAVTRERPVLPSDTAATRAGDLWGYTSLEATARACLAALSAEFKGHEVFYIVAPNTVLDVPSLQLKERFYPEVPVHGDLAGNHGFYNCDKAQRLLGWRHNE